MSVGIDYGMGQTNIDATGVRFGVIPAHALGGFAIEDFEADYGAPTCPHCGGDVEEYDSEKHECTSVETCLIEALKGFSGADAETFKAERVAAAAAMSAAEWNGRGSDYACTTCRRHFDSSDVFGDEPIRHELNTAEYKATLGSDGDVFVLKSPFFTRAAFCSPCAPGACHLLTPNEDGARCYCFGPDWFDDGAPYPVYSVATGERV